MEQEDITKIYETLAPMAGDYANAQAEQIGQAQRSMGTLAGQTMGATTSGLGNYTYNRLMRPQIDVMRDEILVEGYRNQLNKVLSDAYKTAQRNYANSTSNTGTTSNSKGSGVTTITGIGEHSTGSGNVTRWSKLPDSYQWEDENGEWHTATRNKLFSDDEWFRVYRGAKEKAEKEGRGFKG